MTPSQFIAKWRDNPLSERAGAQAFFLDLCALLGVEAPNDADDYCFERGATRTGAGHGWADVWKRGHFGWENKGPGGDLGGALTIANAGGTDAAAPHGERPDGSVTMSEVRCRVRARVTGRVQSVRVRPRSGSSRLELTLADATGAVTVVFLGRQEISGMEIGTTMTIEGMPADHNGRLAFMNPTYELIAPAHPAH